MRKLKDNIIEDINRLKNEYSSVAIITKDYEEVYKRG